MSPRFAMMGVMPKQTITCCEIECVAPAEHMLVHLCGHPECYTHACNDHVGYLIGCNSPELGREDEATTIYPVPQRVGADR